MEEKVLNRRLYWTKNAFSLSHSIYDDGNLVGIIKDSALNRSVQASIFDDKFIFETVGVFKPVINIIDLNNRKEVGRIYFSIFRRRAKIRLTDNIFHFKFINFISRKWMLSDDSGHIIISSDNRKEGFCIIQNERTTLLLLTSLIIKNHFMKQGS